MNKKERSQQGKRNRINGANFEKKVRADLEKSGWVVSKWQNNVELPILEEAQGMHLGKGAWLPRLEPTKGRLVAAKGNRFLLRTTGFPDFVTFKKLGEGIYEHPEAYVVVGVEAKSNGYLDKIEKVKCEWLLSHKIFSKILIASKGKKRGEIVYEEFK